MTDNIVDEIYNLVIASSEFVTNVETATEDLNSIFDNVQQRQSDLITQAVAINACYGSIADLLAEKKKPSIRETSSSFQSLPNSYSIRTHRFLDDIESSLQKHTKKTKKSVEKMISKFNERVEVWMKMSKDLKEQAKIVARNKVKFKVQVDEFRSVLYGYDPDYESSSSDNSD
ncbi:hypothetical protein DCAR_0623475 [Daucus carota subsp. sativus]|uniref:Uncharacterized protein n=1 Tax=Daucus carota subsp. sativus TaxID=79200 RepID=A0A175YCL6_DAUCS|nr:hypothetical protein DCAR_0623475 [Daucus carota subsp. sativus]